MAGRILIVDEETARNQRLERHFASRGYQALGVGGVNAARRQLEESDCPDLVLLDQQLTDSDPLELLDWLRSHHSRLPVVMMVGHQDLELAIEAIQRGAHDFIHKPLVEEELDDIVEQILAHLHLAAPISPPQPAAVAPRGLIGRSRAMLKVSREIALVAASDVRVLIHGESGTGKELAARAIHDHSHRQGPFLAVNCAALVDNLLESELFGHERGAFTGATVAKAGKFELASTGTLFLDEVGELALPLQAKLLRVLQEGSFERVGGTRPLTTTARVITATNRDLKAEVTAGRFRDDLLYRLKVFSIHMPSLWGRVEDIPLLVTGLMERLSRTLKRPPLVVSEAAMIRLLEYDWPGNVRELENVLTQALIRVRSGVLTPELLELEAPLAKSSAGDCARSATGQLLSLQALEARQVRAALLESAGHKGRACAILGISRPALERKIRKYGLPRT